MVTQFHVSYQSNGKAVFANEETHLRPYGPGTHLILKFLTSSRSA